MSPRTAICALIASLLASVAAHAAVIDFDLAPTATSRSQPYDEDGFRIDVADGHFDIWGPSIGGACTGIPCTGNFLGIDNYGFFNQDPVRLVKADGGTFDLLSFNVLQSGTADILLGQAFACTCTVTSSNGGSRLLESQAVMTFSGAEWTNLSWIDFNIVDSTGGRFSSGASIDDITVSAVPLPAAGWLLASALGAALGRAQRRRTRQRI